MDLTPKDQERLRETREDAERAMQNVLDAMAGGVSALRQRAECLQDVISKYPATRDFLRPKGLEHISELDEEGMRELTIYLENVLEEIQQENRRD